MSNWREGHTGKRNSPHRSGQSLKAGTKCQLGFVIYDTRQAAAAASDVGKAKRCGRCRQWHPV